jgi:hypothetical protein
VTNENTGAAGSQADPKAQPQVGASQAQAADAQSSQADGADNESGTVDVAALRRAVEHERQEAAKFRNENRTLRDAAKALEDAKLPEQERMGRRLAELERRETDWERERQDWRMRESVTRGALKLGYRDPTDAFSLIDRAALEYDEGGEPKNVDKLLSDLATAKPYLTGTPRGGSFDGGPRGKPGAGGSFDDALRRATGRA